MDHRWWGGCVIDLEKMAQAKHWQGVEDLSRVAVLGGSAVFSAAVNVFFANHGLILRQVQSTVGATHHV
jgi:hypothetical protein